MYSNGVNSSFLSNHNSKYKLAGTLEYWRNKVSSRAAKCGIVSALLLTTIGASILLYFTLHKGRYYFPG